MLHCRRVSGWTSAPTVLLALVRHRACQPNAAYLPHLGVACGARALHLVTTNVQVPAASASCSSAAGSLTRRSVRTELIGGRRKSMYLVRYGSAGVQDRQS